MRYRACTALCCNLLIAAASNAMRLSAVEEYATLTESSVATLGESRCTAPAGTAVQVLGWPTSLAEPAPATMVFVRVLAGPCADHALTLPQRLLADFRATPQPSVRSAPPSKAPGGG